jgi:uncharacterized GH25 family protein
MARARRAPTLAAACAALAATFGAATAAAHDFWLEPSAITLTAPAEVTLSLRVGDHFHAEEEKPFELRRMVRFVHRHPGGADDLLPRASEGSIPFARLALAGEGGHLLLLDRYPANIELPAVRFEAYLQEEGFTAALDERADRGEEDRPGRERYSRNLKTLLQLGAARDERYAERADQALEIVPREHPVFIDAGKELPVQVYFHQAPLPNARLVALSRAGGEVREATFVTDAEGQALVVIDRAALWQLRTVHMRRCQGCSDADWESFWSSYLFSNERPTALAAAPAALPKRPFTWSVAAALVAATLAVVAAVALLWRARRRLEISSPESIG